MKSSKKICLVIPSLQCGGAERVISQLANKFVEENAVFLILLANTEIFYEVDKQVTLITPDFETAKLNRYFYAAKLFPFLRRKISEIRGLSFLYSLNSSIESFAREFRYRIFYINTLMNI